MTISANGDRALLFLCILAKGLPKHATELLGDDKRTAQLKAFEKISGLP